jgi:hypothetical protein
LTNIVTWHKSWLAGVDAKALVLRQIDEYEGLR